ncbi:Cell division cycle protein 23 [Fasciolopsis buskii]|uniref:Cell division cycle protein 23 n=1 Tax=Fasciolopsis buskii TaxID=27845 RepID=A0A8E0RW78_9TREM|nr:Cell division cycle protein 23 [Fasciolopsis buski]
MKQSVVATDVELPIALDQVRIDVQRAYFECQIRGLSQSCKWLGDIICALDDNPVSSKCDFCVTDLPWTAIPKEHLAKFLFARSLFDSREYDHCAQLLSDCVSPFVRASDDSNSLSSCHPLICFLYVYSRYMACERRKANDEVELRRVFEPDGSAKPSQVAITRARKELASLRREIETYIKLDALDEKRTSQPSSNRDESEYDPFVLYVCALVYCRLGMDPVAVKLLVLALRLNPCLWPAWFELSQLIKDREQLSTIKTPSGSKAWMSYFFEAKVFLKIHESERALNILQRLSNSGFSASGNLQAEIGLAYDGLRDMAMAATQFKQLFTTFPCRLDNVDAYSNVLFVREESAELAYLAHHCVELDKYRPETCCVVGNFFSLRGQHDKAVLYFQRALKLRPSYSLVWTLVGHEYTELRNTNAAVHAYRQAIAHNRHDFRAWYGLGQMYEILDLPSFALYYYRQAQYLAPTDSRLIVALGEIYERLNRVDEAKKCYWRAYCVGDIEGSALVRLAQCFVQCNEDAEAAAAYTEFIKLCDHNGIHSQAELAKAYNYLAAYHLMMGHFEDATAAANKCLEFPETREEAKAMFRQIASWAADAGLVRADGLSDDPSSTANDLSDDAVMDNSRKDALWDDLQAQGRNGSDDTSVAPLPPGGSLASLNGF